MTFAPVLKYKTLKTRSASYMGDFWTQCKALYAGGPTLLNNHKLLKKVMPTHAQESDAVYKERLHRAFYIPYAGSIIDKLVAELTAKPLTFEIGEETEKSLPPYYSDLVKNCARVGGKKMSLNEFAREQIFSALQCQTAWALVDLPKRPAGGFANLSEQTKAGALNAYVCPIDPVSVIDWEEREDGELVWVLIQDTITRRAGIEDSRNLVTLRWRYFRETDWAIYELTYDKTKRPADGPNDQDDCVLVDSGAHSFGRVPVRRLALPEGLWAMGKLEAIARAHLNQRNALSWAQLKALFPVPILYAAAPTPGDPITEDANRVKQTHGQGFMRVFAENDRLEYFSPDAAPYAIAREDLEHLRDEMYRVLYSMAQSVDNSGAALQRSADSKAIDAAAGSVLLKALGKYIREHLEDLLTTIAVGRKDAVEICAQGMESFDDVTLTQLVTDALAINELNIPSPTLAKILNYKIAKLAVGTDSSEENLEKIKQELESAITDESFKQDQEIKKAEQKATLATHEATAKDPMGIKAAKKVKPVS